MPTPQHGQWPGPTRIYKVKNPRSAEETIGRVLQSLGHARDISTSSALLAGKDGGLIKALIANDTLAANRHLGAAAAYLANNGHDTNAKAWVFDELYLRNKVAIAACQNFNKQPAYALDPCTILPSAHPKMESLADWRKIWRKKPDTSELLKTARQKRIPDTQLLAIMALLSVATIYDLEQALSGTYNYENLWKIFYPTTNVWPDVHPEPLFDQCDVTGRVTTSVDTHTIRTTPLTA